MESSAASRRVIKPCKLSSIGVLCARSVQACDWHTHTHRGDKKERACDSRVMGRLRTGEGRQGKTSERRGETDERQTRTHYVERMVCCVWDVLHLARGTVYGEISDANL